MFGIVRQKLLISDTIEVGRLLLFGLEGECFFFEGCAVRLEILGLLDEFILGVPFQDCRNLMIFFKQQMVFFLDTAL